MNKHLFSKQMIVATMAVALVFSACEKRDDAPTAGTYYGPEVQVGDGSAKSWVSLDEAGNPFSIGVILTEQAVESLSHHHHEEVSRQHDAGDEFVSFTLALPPQKAKTPFDHITIDWNEHGHPPAQIYDKPHFDFHFYMITQGERQTIGLDDPKSEILPEPQYLPASYIPIPGGVPQMGKHWVDPSSPEFNGGSFANTFLYGSHNGKLTFYEPMITLDYLQQKQDETIAIAQPEAFQKAGYYPTHYRVSYDASKKEYHIALGGMSKQ